MASEPLKDVPAVDPAAVEPTITAAEATSDPIRPTGTDALMAESRPEVADASTVPATTDLPKEENLAKDEVKVEAQPVAAGNLGYKAPGLIKSLRFTTKYFWFGDEAIDEKSLSTYLKTEKPEVGHHNAALATQTGRGLLLFAKREEDKSSPQGILNLNGATDITKEGAFDFSFKLNGHKHTFQAGLAPERDAWLVAVEKAIVEAGSTHDGVVSSDAYKSKLGKFGKPAGVASAATTSKTAIPSAKTDDKAHDGTTQGESTAAATAEANPRTEKSRSQSRKRASIFGKYLNKKEEAEVKIEARKEERAEKKEEEKIEKEEKKAEEEEAKKQDESAPATTTDLVSATETTKPSTDDTTPNTPDATTCTTKSKRASVFGSLPFLNKKDKETPAKKEEAPPAVPNKDTAEPVAEAAPQLDPVGTTPTTDLTAPADTATTESPTDAPITTATATTPKAEKQESKGGLFGFLKQKEAQHEAKKEEKEADKATETTPVAADNTTSQETSLKDKRRSSFFGTLSGKKERRSAETKEKKSESAISDAEATDGEGKKSNKLQGLFRKASKSSKPTTGPVTDSSAPPAVPTKEEEGPATAPGLEVATEATNSPKTSGDAEATNSTGLTESATPVTAAA